MQCKSYMETFLKTINVQLKIIFINSLLNFENLFRKACIDNGRLFGILGDSEVVILIFVFDYNTFLEIKKYLCLFTRYSPPRNHQSSV